MTQRERLEAVLRDCYPHRSDELVRQVYGPGCSLARLAARVHDVKRALPPGWTVRGWKDKENPTLYWYRLEPPPAATAGQGELFKREA